MRQIREKCSDCGVESNARFGESDSGWPRSLAHWRSFHCCACGSRYEADGAGPLPDELRTIELAEGGIWCLSLDNVSLESLNELRVVLVLGLPELAQVKACAGREILFGTEWEVRRISSALSDRGVSVTLSSGEPTNGLFNIRDVWRTLLAR